MATNTFSDLYNATSLKPTPPFPIGSPDGCDIVPFVHTIPTTELDEIANFIALVPVPCGKRLLGILLQSSAAGDTGTALDMDWTLRIYDSAGTATDLQLVNNGTIFEAALTNQLWVLARIQVPVSRDGYGDFGLKVVAAATTPAEMIVRGALIYG